MIAALLLLAIAGSPAGGDPCAVPTAAPQADPALAAAYGAVGEEEAARGSFDTAAAAFREGLRNAPADARLLAGFTLACRKSLSGASGGRFEEGVARMNAGDRAGAIAAFEEVRAAGDDPGAALLEGICAYELGEADRARRLLEEARGEPRAAPAASLFLGLLSLRRGDAPEAAAFFEAAERAQDGAVRTSAAGLLRTARRGGKLTLSLLAAAAADSNADLSPDGAPNPKGSTDASGAAAAALVFRPTGEEGLYGRALGSYHKLARFDAFDLGLLEAAAGYQAGPAPRHLSFEYAYDFAALGGAAYLSAHRLRAGGRITAGAVAFSAAYTLRFESFLTTPSSGYSGTRHAGEVEAAVGLSGGAVVGGGYVGARDLAQDPGLAYDEHGPRAFARLPATASLTLVLESSLLFRRYALRDQALGVQRADAYLDGGAAAELELDDRFTLRIGLGARRAFSNASDFVYTQFAGSLSLSTTLGLL